MHSIGRLMAIAMLGLYPVGAPASECVLLLHGMVRTAKSMERLQYQLEGRGYVVANIDSPIPS